MQTALTHHSQVIAIIILRIDCRGGGVSYHKIKCSYLHLISEFICDIEENERRSRGGRISPEYHCVELKAQRTIYPEEVYEDGVGGKGVVVRYRAGCDIRCVNKNCDVPTGDESEKQKIPRDSEPSKFSEKQINPRDSEPSKFSEKQIISRDSEPSKFSDYRSTVDNEQLIKESVIEDNIDDIIQFTEDDDDDEDDEDEDDDKDSKASISDDNSGTENREITDAYDTGTGQDKVQGMSNDFGAEQDHQMQWVRKLCRGNDRQNVICKAVKGRMI